MSYFKKVLVAAALTEENAPKMKAAMDFVESIQAEAVLLHCVSELTNMPSEYLSQGDIGHMMENNIITVTKELEKIKSLYPNVKTEVEITLEEPLNGILKTVADYKCDLIVMGASTKTRLEKFFLGSIASSVLNAATVPVLLLR